MTREEALQIIEENELEFTIEDSGEEDGSVVIESFIIDSKENAEELLQALNVLLKGE